MVYDISHNKSCYKGVLLYSRVQNIKGIHSDNEGVPEQIKTVLFDRSVPNGPIKINNLSWEFPELWLIAKY